MPENKVPEPWLRGTLTEVSPVQRAVLHALQLAEEDLEHWCYQLSDRDFNAQLHGLTPLAYHLRHIPRSIDRLLTYAEGGQLNSEQIAQLKSELDPGARRDELFEELHSTLARAAERIRAIESSTLDEQRLVGKKQIPTTVAGLLVHVADHTQRHTGQAVTTAKLALVLHQEEVATSRKSYPDSSYRHQDPT